MGTSSTLAKSMSTTPIATIDQAIQALASKRGQSPVTGERADRVRNDDVGWGSHVACARRVCAS